MNKVKEKVKNNQLTIGSWITIGDPVVVEILASAGFDWLCVDIEHTAIDLKTTENLIRTIQANGMEALVRVSKNDEVIIKRVLDMKADGIIVPMVNSREDAIQAVNFAKYPPFGKRGVGLYRAQNYGIGFKEYKDKVDNDNLLIIAQIEHIEAVNNIEEILQVNGIDGTIIGPYDLSGSLGTPGEYHRDEVKDAITKVQNICQKVGKPYGYHVIESDPSKVMNKIDEGCRFLAYSLDFFFLGDLARAGMQKIKNHS